uniref:Cytochrome P450 n=1 Tax=Heterorhabditis bacteriophora TaxID=37862 RepID=A0A1I7XI86_HETBA
MQGPAALPLIGNILQFHFKPEEFFEQAQGLSYMLRRGTDRICRIWLGPLPFVLLYGPEECEAVLGSSIKYAVFNTCQVKEAFSDPDKWRPRRKLLTPTFHYDILKDFVEVYNRHARTLIEKFKKLSEKDTYTDIFHTVTYCTLDIICEAALGICIDAQNKPNSPYLDSVFKMKYIIHQRQVLPIYYPEFIFNTFGAGREQAKCVKILHDFTGKVIRARKAKADAAGDVEKLISQESAEGRRRMAFLDLMLDMNAKGNLDMEGIQEEVDTFTFEGHDTTSAAINWFLHLMGANPSVQSKVHKEIDEVLGESNRAVTYEDIGRFRYLEACIKETLRLYPSVPIIARQVVEDLKMKNHLLPAGTGVVMIPSMVHKDPRYWDDPEIFRPERFLDRELKHPYAYIPFSAGSRNCIGEI